MLFSLKVRFCLQLFEYHDGVALMGTHLLRIILIPCGAAESHRYLDKEGTHEAVEIVRVLTQEGVSAKLAVLKNDLKNMERKNGMISYIPSTDKQVLGFCLSGDFFGKVANVKQNVFSREMQDVFDVISFYPLSTAKT